MLDCFTSDEVNILIFFNIHIILSTENENRNDNKFNQTSCTLIKY